MKQSGIEGPFYNEKEWKGNILTEYGMSVISIMMICLIFFITTIFIWHLYLVSTIINTQIENYGLVKSSRIDFTDVYIIPFTVYDNKDVETEIKYLLNRLSFEYFDLLTIVMGYNIYFVEEIPNEIEHYPTTEKRYYLKNYSGQRKI